MITTHNKPLQSDAAAGGSGGTMMRKHRIHLIALGVVVAWALFSYMYLGVEDGSSGLSPAGWLHALFFIPGSFAMQLLKGSHTTSDLPVMAGIGWLAYSVVALGFAHAIYLLSKSKTREANS